MNDTIFKKKTRINKPSLKERISLKLLFWPLFTCAIISVRLQCSGAAKNYHKSKSFLHSLASQTTVMQTAFILLLPTNSSSSTRPEKPAYRCGLSGNLKDRPAAATQFVKDGKTHIASERCNRKPTIKAFSFTFLSRNGSVQKTCRSFYSLFEC